MGAGDPTPNFRKRRLCHMGPFFLFMPFIFFFSITHAYGGEAARDAPIVGGPCEYRNYEGTARIASIKKVAERGDPSEDKFEIRFVFLPKEKIKESFAQVGGREFVLQIHNMSYFGPRFIEENRIQVEVTIDCILKVIIRGTCTPILFEFPSLKLEEK